MTAPNAPDQRAVEPGERPRADGRPLLERAPGERYRPPSDRAAATADARGWYPAAVLVGAALVYTVLGGVLAVTAGLVVVAALTGWIAGRLVSPPSRAAVVALLAVVAGLAGVWLFGRLEGGVLDPIAYLDEVQGWPLVALQLLAGGGMAAAASK